MEPWRFRPRKDVQMENGKEILEELKPRLLEVVKARLLCLEQLFFVRRSIWKRPLQRWLEAYKKLSA